MEIKDYSDLTNFMSDENLKMQETYGAKKVSPKMLDFSENNLIKYAKLYDRPLYRKAKRKIIFEEALDTMPHGFIWKIFHTSLWRKIKPYQQEFLEQIKKTKKPPRMAEAENRAKEELNTLYPEIVKNVSVPQISEDD